MAAKKRKPAIEKPEGIVDDFIYPVIKGAAKKFGRNKRKVASTIRSMDDRIYASKKSKEMKQAVKHADWRGGTVEPAKSPAEIRKEVQMGRQRVQGGKAVAAGQYRAAKVTARRKNPYPSLREQRLTEQEARYMFRYGRGTLHSEGGAKKVGGPYYTERTERVSSKARANAYAKKEKAAIKAARKSKKK
jgi:hypothetical protein